MEHTSPGRVVISKLGELEESIEERIDRRIHVALQQSVRNGQDAYAGDGPQPAVCSQCNCRFLSWIAHDRPYRYPQY